MSPCDTQTDGRTDGIAIAYARLAYMLLRAKTTYPTPRMINEVITIAIRLRYDFDATTIRLRHIARACFQFDASKKMNMSIFRRARSRIVVESQL